ncbi:MAG TPA: MGMT family protein, partial [Myxococcales bacterium]|nr:MGMT family protein [Myxococcales bacterium]
MLFETRAGPVRLRWNERGLTAIEMPELPPRALRAELAKQNGTQAPPFVREAARLLERHLAGEAQDLVALPLDLSLLAPFQRAVYDKVRDLPPGRTATYGEIAALLGKPGASRAVGQALGRNPFLVAVPCHRVLAAGGAPGGFSAPGGVIAKQRLLALEGVTLAVDHGLPFDPV